MTYAERVTSVTAALSALTTLLCCIPIGFAAAAATASVAAIVADLRPWLIGASIFLIGSGFVQLCVGKRSCERRTRANVITLWLSAAVVALVVFFPQFVASMIADLMPAR